MKKNALVIFAIIVSVVLTSMSAFAAGTCGDPITHRTNLANQKTNAYVVSFSCVADAADGSIPDVNIGSVGGNLIAVYVEMGATAPTSGAYDVLVTADSMNDIDLLFGAGADLTTTADIGVTPLIGAVSAPATFYGDLTVSQTGNAVNSATPTIYVTLQP